VLLGDSGSGKTHLLIGLGIAACEQARRARYATDERRHTTPGFDRRAKNCDVAAPRSAARLDLDPSWFHASSHLTTNGSWLSTTAARTSATARRAHDKAERPGESHHHPSNARLRIFGDRQQPVDKKTSSLVARQVSISPETTPSPTDPGPCHGATDLRGGANLGEHRWGQSHLTQPSPSTDG
jgi:hypothetical protein